MVGFKSAPIFSIDDLHRALVGAEIGVESNLTVIRGTELVELPVGNCLNEAVRNESRQDARATL
jgi:hypothetical protein